MTEQAFMAVASILKSLVLIVGISAIMLVYYIAASAPTNCPQCGGNLDVYVDPSTRAHSQSK